MGDRTPNQNSAEVLKEFANIGKEIGELSVAMAAQHAALKDSFPQFEARYLEHLRDQRCLQLKSEYEHRIRALLEAAQKMSES